MTKLGPKAEQRSKAEYYGRLEWEDSSIAVDPPTDAILERQRKQAQLPGVAALATDQDVDFTTPPVS